MTYGENLVVPGEFFPLADDTNEDIRHNLERKRAIVGKFAPCRPSKTNARSVYIPATLYNTKNVFVRHDAVRPSLTPPYKGPYRVLKRGDKAFLLEIGDVRDWVSIDRLKPAYMDAAELLPPQTITQSGRISRPPVRLEL